MNENKKQVTQILKNFSDKNRKADLYPIVYDNLHEIADKLYRRERPEHPNWEKCCFKKVKGKCHLSDTNYLDMDDKIICLEYAESC